MLPRELATLLSDLAQPCVDKVLARNGARTGKPAGEVSAVRTMTLYGFGEIARAWSPILESLGYRIDLHGVFCHSAPQVTFAPVPHPNFRNGSTPRRCELADLLIVIDHVDHSKKINERCASLIQAKMLDRGALNPKRQEWVQHELLAWLPSFKFVSSAYDTRPRDLNRSPQVGVPAYTAEYAGIALGSLPIEWRHELTQQNAPWFHSPISLAAYLARMATGSRACGRKAVSGGLDDWSFTVDELLRVTAKYPISENYNFSRGTSNVVGFAGTSSPADGGDGGSGRFGEGIDEWPDGPISTIHMTLGPSDAPREE